MEPLFFKENGDRIGYRMQFCYTGSTTPLLVLDRGEGNARATRVLGGKEDLKVTFIPFHTLKGNVKGTGPFRSGIVGSCGQ